MARAQSVLWEHAGCVGDKGRGNAGTHSELGAVMEDEVGEPGATQPMATTLTLS